MKKNIISIISITFFFISMLFLIQYGSLYPAYFYGIPEKLNESENSNIKYEYLNNKKIKTIFLKGDSNKPVIIFFHGNYELIGNNYNYFEKINKKTKFNILMVEYNGYGNSEGYPSLKSTNKSIIEWLEKNQKFKEYIIWGKSIGSAHAYDFAMNNPIYSNKLIIQSGFLSPLNAITNNEKEAKLLSYLMFFDYEAKNKINEIIKNNNIKNILIIHGKEDLLFNIKYANETYNIFENKINTKKMFVNGGHNNIKIKEKELVEFLNL